MLSLVLLLTLVSHATSHGMVTSPRSRNWVAYQDGGSSGIGVPPNEWCAQCLNRNTGVCGKATTYDYDNWLDVQGTPMAWNAQATYVQGSIVTIEFRITAYHMGHVEIKACPDGRASTQACFDEHPLVLVQDRLHGMAPDPSYPERAYLGGSADMYIMDFQLPVDVSGPQVLLQWKYLTSNSCHFPGYEEYFGTPMVTGMCPAVLSTTGEGAPEQFWNCMEVSITEIRQVDLTAAPTSPTASPSAEPSESLSREPSAVPSTKASASPSPQPTKSPSLRPSGDWSMSPTLTRTVEPTVVPSVTGSASPSDAHNWEEEPSESPSQKASSSPSTAPVTEEPTGAASTFLPTGTIVTEHPTFPAATDSPTGSPETTDSYCCSQDYKTCISWCGTTEAGCDACWNTVWIPTNRVVDACRGLWTGCDLEATSGTQADCCDGLVCVGTNWWKQCAVP